MSHDDFFNALGDAPEGGEEHPTVPEGRRARRQRQEDRRRRRRRRAVRSLVIVVLLAALVGAVGYYAVHVIGDARSSVGTVSDYTGAGDDEVTVTIPDGASGSQIAAILVDANVVASQKAFTEAYAANANSSKIQAGTYTLRRRMSAVNAVALLLDPASRSDHSLTIPEGFTKAQVKDRLMSVAGYTAEEVDAAFSAVAASLPAGANGEIEGWLAPSTYDLPEGTTALDVVTSMVETTKARLLAAGVAEADFETVLIKASIVEREVASAEYYGQVARVIENRLADTAGETRGFLQMDSTVLYGLGRSGGIPTTAELADASNAYNTYQHAGLPPSPIDSPGEAAVKAVLNPPEGSWLYFVTVNLDTGETLFATTHDEQQANTDKLKEYCAEHAQTCAGDS